MLDPEILEHVRLVSTSSNFRYPGTAHTKKWTESDLSFCKNAGSKNLKLMEKEVNWIENEGKIDTKCLKLTQNA